MKDLFSCEILFIAILVNLNLICQIYEEKRALPQCAHDVMFDIQNISHNNTRPSDNIMNISKQLNIQFDFIFFKQNDNFHSSRPLSSSLRLPHSGRLMTSDDVIVPELEEQWNVVEIGEVIQRTQVVVPLGKGRRRGRGN